MSLKPSLLLPLAGLLVALSTPIVAHSYFWPHVSWRTISNDGFYSYDFDSQSVNDNNVDWPFNMIWYDEANINDVKSYLSSRGFSGSGSAKYAYVYETSNVNAPEWDTDGGKKSGCYTDSVGNKRFRHTRLYAPTDSPYYDAFFDVYTYGYYIVATTHYDINETSGCDAGNPWFGYSEDLENYIADLADDNFVVSRDSYYLNNAGYGVYDPGVKPGLNHYHQSDGYATKIRFY